MSVPSNGACSKYGFKLSHADPLKRTSFPDEVGGHGESQSPPARRREMFAERTSLKGKIEWLR